LKIHPLFDLGEVGVIDLLNILNVGLEDIVNIHGPQLLISKLLPIFEVIVGHDALLDHLLERLMEGRADSRVLVLVLGDTHEDLPELVTAEIVRVRALVRCDEASVDCGQVDGLVIDLALFDEDGEVDHADIRETSTLRDQVNEDLLQQGDVFLD